MPQKISKKICRFLKIEYSDMYSDLKRVNTPNYQDYIINWDEIRELREVINI